MKRMKVGLMELAILFTVVAHVQAVTISLDFEEFNDRDNLHGVNLGGVTLTNPSGVVEVHENRFGVSSHSLTKAIASPAGLSSVNPLVGVFDRPVTFVSLWGGDEGWKPDEMDSWDLLAFDAPAGGNLLGRASSGVWSGNPYRQLAITADNIWRFEANWTGQQFGIGYDDLQFEFQSVIVPEPSTFAMLSISAVGLLGCAWCLRRR
jgi:hypothetical protein